jgi:hypothetical protein
MPFDAILRDWSARRGWEESTQLFLALRYAELCGDAPSFAAFLAQVAAAEDQEGVQDENEPDGPAASRPPQLSTPLRGGNS